MCGRDGLLFVHLSIPMRYATGTGKFHPKFSSVPNFTAKLVSSPYQEKDMVDISSGCGTIRDFNVHLKAREGNLEAGSYVFEYIAYETNEIE